MTFNFDVVIYLLGLACTAGIMVCRIGALEKKVDKHNSLIERMYKVEERSKSNSHRIDELRKEIENG